MDDIDTTLLPSTWPEDYEPPGRCDDCLVCDLPVVECLGSTRFQLLPDLDNGIEGIPFGDWSEYSSDGFLQSSFNGGPGNDEQQLRVKIIVHQNKTPCMVQYREMISHEIGTGDHIATVFESGDINTIVVAEGDTGPLETLYDVMPSSINHATFVVSGPFRGKGGYIFTKQVAKLKKRGFWVYGGGDYHAPKIYRAELVTSAGEPGCALSTPPRAPKTYTGGQTYVTETASSDNGHLLDLSHTYHDTRSQDLKDDKHATTPYTMPSQTVEFGVVDYPADTLKRMVQTYKCGTVDKEKFILLQLSAEYKTEDLVANVDAAILAQITDPAGLSSELTASGYTVVHKYYLSADETEYDRVRGTNFGGGPEESEVEVYTSLDVGAISNVTCKVDVYTRDLVAGTIALSFKSFDMPFYADRNFGPLSTAGRSLVEPEVTPDAPVNDPYSADEFKNKEVLFGAVHRKGHYTLFARLPYADYPFVLVDGYDGGPV